MHYLKRLETAQGEIAGLTKQAVSLIVEECQKDDTWHKFDILSQYQALRDYKWVADNVELSRRHDKLKFGHHSGDSHATIPFRAKTA